MIRFRATAGEHSHPVLIGAVGDAAQAFREFGSSGPWPLVTDDHVLALHSERLRGLFDFVPLLLPRGETAKNWDTLRNLIQSFSDLDVSRRTPIVAFGGGSVGDVTGLAAALFKRGCPVIHVPTTLLAQVDSAIGGKTAIDAAGQKNLVGTFHLPGLVVADPAFLATLDERQLRSGYAEVLKYGLIEDPAFFGWCEQNGTPLLAGEAAARLYATEYCLKSKARFVAEDLHDLNGRRALLNLGHSFGHAIEALSGFGRVLHGEAVAVGMALAYGYSAAKGLCPAADYQRVSTHLGDAGLPQRLGDVGISASASELVALMCQDKKALSGKLTLILTRGIGQAFVAPDVDAPDVEAFLATA
ncbi:MAG: 3-dehydroquinate synthase [Pseudomonadota bacterium]|nr:3-dehydroquinate synthase [Pseudomonadota bacterium]